MCFEGAAVLGGQRRSGAVGSFTEIFFVLGVCFWLLLRKPGVRLIYVLHASKVSKNVF